MKTFTLFRWAILSGCLSLSTQAWATHAAGGEILYEPIPGSTNRYHVTMQLFKNTENTMIDYGPTKSLYCAKNGCDINSAGSFVAELQRTRRVTLDAVRCGIVISEMIVFEGDITLPPGRWLLSTWEENRSVGIRNIAQSASSTQYFESFLDNSSGLVNSSPRFTTLKIPYLSGNQSTVYSSSAFDIDGDSLTYQVVTPKENKTVSQGQYVCATDIPSYQTAPHFTIDAATGALLPTAAPLEVGDFVLPVRVDEFRKINNVWTKIGSVTREQVYRAYSSTNLNPTFTGFTVNSSTITQPLEQVIKVNPGQTVALTLTASDPDTGQKLRFVSDVPSVVPGASIQTLNDTQARLTWAVPATLPLGRYRLTVAVADDGCPINASEVRTLTFWVTNQVLSAKKAQPLILSASPNPFRTQVLFNVATAQTVTITDGLGRLVERVASRPDGTVTWRPAASVAPGIYFARTADGQQLVRLVRE